MRAEFLRYLLTRAGPSEALVIVPRVPGGPGGAPRWQPLCAVYRRAFLSHAEEALRRERNRIDRLFAEVPVLVIEADEIANQGFDANIFENVNTPEDLVRIIGPSGHRVIGPSSHRGGIR